MLNIEKNMVDKLNELRLKSNKQTWRKLCRYLTHPFAVYNDLTNTVVFIYVLYFMGKFDEIQIETIITFYFATLLFNRLSHNYLWSTLAEIKKMKKLFYDIHEYLDADDTNDDIEQDFLKPSIQSIGELNNVTITKNKQTDCKGKIEFICVSFKYPDTDNYVLRNCSFVINAGEHVAFFGGSGSGKSTVVKILLKFYEISEGNIFIDGNNFKSMSYQDVRKYFGVVMQDPILFKGSILYNIKYNNYEATNEDIKNAAILSNSMEFITNSNISPIGSNRSLDLPEKSDSVASTKHDKITENNFDTVQIG